MNVINSYNFIVDIEFGYSFMYVLYPLYRWKIVVHACIDGFSRMCTYLIASPDNTAATAFASFLRGVAEYGAPRFLRVDAGVENGRIIRYMRLLRGANGALLGRSVHNVRIERLWRDVRTQVGVVFLATFTIIEERGLLNPNSANDIRTLQLFFLPIINAALEEFRRMWNVHTVRTASHRTPEQLALLSARSYPSAAGIVDVREQQTRALWLLEDPSLRARVALPLQSARSRTPEQWALEYLRFIRAMRS